MFSKLFAKGSCSPDLPVCFAVMLQISDLPESLLENPYQQILARQLIN